MSLTRLCCKCSLHWYVQITVFFTVLKTGQDTFEFEDIPEQDTGASNPLDEFDPNEFEEELSPLGELHQGDNEEATNEETTGPGGAGETNDQGESGNSDERPLSPAVEEPPPPESTTNSRTHATASYTRQEVDAIHQATVVEDVRLAQQYIHLLKNARIDDARHHPLSATARDRLRNPPTSRVNLKEEQALRISLSFILGNPTDAQYARECRTIEKEIEGLKCLSKAQVEDELAKLTGVEAMRSDMCPGTCVAFTGPLDELEKCPKCGEERYEPRKSVKDALVPRRTFITMPLAFQIQALWRHVDSATRMRWRDTITEHIRNQLRDGDKSVLDQFDDITKGHDYLRAFDEGKIQSGDTVLMFSIDGAQLYACKQSDCWIYIWVLFDQSPDHRYKKQYVLPGAVIPGPNKPKNLDSFLFPGLFHLAAVQNEGLVIFDGLENRLRTTYLYLFVVVADGPGMAFITGLVGHHGKYGCRLYCGFPGRHPPQKPHYYPALKKPRGYDVDGCMHPSIHAEDLPRAGSGNYHDNLEHVAGASDLTSYRNLRLETGIVKPTIFLGLPRTLPIPKLFGSDIMHIAALNVGDLFIPLWRGKFTHHRTDDPDQWKWAVFADKELWDQHGDIVRLLATFLPGSFDRPPRDIAKKLNSGYKAWEWLLYLYGLGPALYFGILPDPYYTNFCRLVRGIRLLSQHSISAEQVQEARTQLNSFADEFEKIYVERLPERLHFVRPWLHAVTHLAREVVRKGPPLCASQWTMERTIGDLGREIRSHTHPYANLANRAVHRARVNAIKVLYPELDADNEDSQSNDKLPAASRDVGDGYIILARVERYLRPVVPLETRAISSALREHGFIVQGIPSLQRRARLRLPNGQIARSAWKEATMTKGVRQSRNVKIMMPHSTEPSYAEVRYYFIAKINDVTMGFAMVSLYGRPDVQLRDKSLNNIHACRYHGDTALRVINVKTIQSVVAMVPHKFPNHNEILHFAMEKPGLDVAVFGALEDLISSQSLHTDSN
ncbi:hypothetical protein CONPUDRAFT_68274 [Coniophora puteana RWD-64-598 SS2]|uniref:Transposase family Tnp2 protein n=1 Tax=Coniophora puteana (strain RWD-64-598) TaxID=741705 RepID=R7SDL8_CONPW|nr:uncharacterized protein CONPUDRAFT_68274 [Coniophora puteana RWD-64-598 SS2]EIW73857.1 hypothetical protein CONPUDRAFT_68274 [Coniophora puteana RWD-64-598 SS2]